MKTTKHQTRRGPSALERRGNTIVMVAALLVLLVIIAAAFVSRTQSSRGVMKASNDAEKSEDIHRSVAGDLAHEIGRALFAGPIDTTDSFFAATGNSAAAHSNNKRLLPRLDAPRYGVDPTDVLNNTTGAPGSDGIIDFPYNFAAFETVPSTNWPDALDPTLIALLPPGPGNPGDPTGAGPTVPGSASLLMLFEGNQLGNPGYGDNRWLADIEPLRFTMANGIERFSHWRHLSYIARAGNGYRIVPNISNVGGLGVTDLNLPVEQWLATPGDLTGVYTNNPDSIFPGALTGNGVTVPFRAQWDFWFGLKNPANTITSLGDYLSIYADPTRIPPNLYRLKDVNGNGVPMEIGERPQDAFIPGTARHLVESVLADADGDGFTDSLWALVPQTIESGVRHIVAVRIIDNGGMLNTNVATRFERQSAGYFGLIATPTIGAHPGELALVGENENAWTTPPSEFTWNVGYFDNGFNRENWMVNIPPGSYGTALVGWDPTHWGVVLDELGVTSNPVLFPNQLRDGFERRLYWLLKGRRGLTPDITSGLSNFGLSDEIELRMYNANNYPWIFSRFEGAVNEYSDATNSFLHSASTREESSEYLDQLRNPEWLRDHRHQLTMYNGSRNDIMPPWLRGPDGDTFTPNLYLEKIDLRAPFTDVNAVRDAIERALKFESGVVRQTYFGDTGVGATLSEEAASALLANIEAYRDVDGLLDNTHNGFVGMEAQPFILEAFIGHVYKAFKVPPVDFEGDPFTNSGSFVVFNQPKLGQPGFSENRGTVVVVQLANPYDVAINLSGYTLNVFGQSAALSGTLAPGTPDHPVTGVFYAITATIDPPWDTSDNLETKWRDFLDIQSADHPNDLLLGTTILDQVVGFDVFDRTTYDSPPAALTSAIDLERGGIVIDRIDAPMAPASETFLEAVTDMAGNRPVDVIDPLLVDADPFGTPFPGHDLGGGAGNKHWVQWVRATRAWGVDLNNSGEYERHEWNPRFIYADKTIVESQDDNSTDGSFIAGGNQYDFASSPDDPWFNGQFMPASGGPLMTHKPTFFDMALGLNGGVGPLSLIPDYPDKGWYGQIDTATGDLAGVTDPTRDPVLSTTLSRMPYPLQMLQKDGDFDQVGELLNVWVFGHKTLGGGTDTTFSEYLSREHELETGRDMRVNRLHPAPVDVDGDYIADLGFIIGGMPYDATVAMPAAYLGDGRHYVPSLPSGLRVLDLFVCDSFGLAPMTDLNGDSMIDAIDEELRRYANANGFTGRATPGLININTAPREVLMALPHWYRLVHSEPNTGIWPLNLNPYTRVADSLVRYRERFGLPLDVSGNDGFAAAYGDRGLQGAFVDWFGAPYNTMHRDNSRIGLESVRSSRGFASPSELNLLTRSGKAARVIGADPISGGSALQYNGAAHAQIAFPTSLFGENEDVFNSSWRIDMPAMPERSSFEQQVMVTASNLFFVDHPAGSDYLDRLNAAALSTDVQHIDESPADPLSNFLRPDKIAEDVEEANLLYAGASNLVTTNSDVFTVYFKIRSFRQNPVTGIWDATDPDYIVSESRYVMLVDRSQVNNPNDQPKILYLEELPN